VGIGRTECSTGVLGSQAFGARRTRKGAKDAKRRGAVFAAAVVVMVLTGWKGLCKM